jgi:DNA invertase Pin-like site-specific DNA recombinase
MSTTKPGLRAVLYLRISDLTDTSSSITRQEKEGRQKADALGAEVTRVFKDEDKSGYHVHVERPGFDDALDEMRERRADLLVVYKVDRATRQGIPQASDIIRIVYETGCRFVSVADGIDSANIGWELQLSFAAHQAHSESKNTATRVGNLRHYERDEGRWMGHRPYGFRVTPERKLEAHLSEAKVIRAVVKKLLEGESLRAVAKWLNENEHDSPRWASRKERVAQLEAKGEPIKARKLREKPMKNPNSWTWTVVRNLVVSPTVVGYLPHKGEIYRHSETGEPVRVGPEIISLAEHTRLRSMFGSRPPVHWTRTATPGSKSKDTGRSVRGLLTDFLYCGECGSRMEYDTCWVRKGVVVPRYRCGRRSRGGRCPGVLMHAAGAESLVFGSVVSRVSSREYDDPVVLAIAERWENANHPEHAARKAELEASIREEEQFLDRLEEEKLNGLFKGQRGEVRFQRRYEASNERLEQFEKELSAIPDGQTVDVGFINVMEEFAEAWDKYSLSEQRDFLGLILERAWVHKARTVGVRPSLDRFKFWFVGDPEPPAVGGAMSLASEG